MTRLLLSEVFPPQTGGSGRWLWEIYRRFPADTVRFAVGQSPRCEEFDRQHELRLQRLTFSLPTWGLLQTAGLRGYLRLTRQIASIVRDCEVDCIHCGKALPEGFLALLMGIWKGVSYVVYVHGEELNIAEGSRELRWMTRRTLRRASKVVANSENTAEILRQRWQVSADRLCVLTPGVDVDFFEPTESKGEIRRQLGWQDRTVLLTVGRLQIRKGHDQLIRALETIRKEIPNVLYAIVGNGVEQSSLKALVGQLGLDDLVQFRTDADDQELLQCYQQCDLFVLPNRTVRGDFEGFGMVLLEAQACGKPVLAGASGGTRETMNLGVTGQVTDCEDVTGLAHAVINLLQSPSQRQGMGEAARQWVVENFSWESLSQQAAKLFDLRPSPSADNKRPRDDYSLPNVPCGARPDA